MQQQCRQQIFINIPLLVYNKLLERLCAVIGMGQGKVHFAALGVTVPLQRFGGHFAIDSFPSQPRELTCWSEITTSTDWKRPDPELILLLTSQSHVLATSATPSASASQEAKPVTTTYHK